MPILQQNDAAAVARYTEFVTRSPWGNLMQDRGWAHVKKGWVGEQVYLEQNGEITAAMSIIFAPAVAGRTLAYAPRGPVCDPYDTETIAALMREAAPALKKHRAFLLRFDPETPYTDELIAKYEKLGLRCRARNCGLHDQIQPRFNMFLPLEGKTLEELMPAFGEKTRYNIRLSARKGVTTRWAGAEELEAFNEAAVLEVDGQVVPTDKIRYTYKKQGWFTESTSELPTKPGTYTQTAEIGGNYNCSKISRNIIVK